MDKPISQGLKIIFLIHAIISVIFGVGLWLAPGRFLILVGWVLPEVELWVFETIVEAPGTLLVDPFITRILGAALLALAYTSFKGWRANQWGEVALVVQMEAVFCIVGLLGMIITLILSPDMPVFSQLGGMPAFGWVLMVILAGFTLAWLWALLRHTKD